MYLSFKINLFIDKGEQSVYILYCLNLNDGTKWLCLTGVGIASHCPRDHICLVLPPRELMAAVSYTICEEQHNVLITKLFLYANGHALCLW